MFKTDKQTSASVAQQFGPMRMITVIALLCCLLISVFTIYFLYRNVYLRRADAESIMAHPEADLLHAVNTNALEHVLSSWNSKHATGTVQFPSSFVSNPIASPMRAEPLIIER